MRVAGGGPTAWPARCVRWQHQLRCHADRVEEEHGVEVHLRHLLGLLLRLGDVERAAPGS